MFSKQQLRTLLFFYIAVLVIGSFAPTPAKQWLGTRPAEGISAISATPSLAHRWWHIAGFGMAALLASATTRIPRALALQSAGLIALGAVIECLQMFISAADLEWWDIRDDGYGIVGLTIFGQLGIIRKILLKDGIERLNLERVDNQWT